MISHNHFTHPDIAAVVLAAGQSRRMGQPKMTLPWGGTTVVGQVIDVLKRAGVPEITVVTGGDRQEVDAALTWVQVHIVFNPDYARGEMLSSIQVGLRALGSQVEAALVALGDQPQIQPGVVNGVISRFDEAHPALVVPSYQLHRGHPWLVRRDLWPEVLALPAVLTLRDFLASHATEIDYFVVNTPSVLADLDTPDQYQAQKPE